jgi:uncharacterized membrane protein
MSSLKNPLIDRYLARFRDGLKGAPGEERTDFVNEIDSHIAEAVAGGAQATDVLARLGPPDRLAKAYRAELMLSSGEGNLLLRFAAVIGLVITASIPSMIIIPLMLALGVASMGIGGTVIVFAAVPALEADFYNISNEILNRLMGALTGLGLVVAGFLALWILYLYVLLLVKAMRGALRVGSPG